MRMHAVARHVSAAAHVRRTGLCGAPAFTGRAPAATRTAVPARGLPVPQRRYLAARAEKSWGELLDEAGQLAKNAATKLGSQLKEGVSKAIELVVPPEAAPLERKEHEQRSPYRPPAQPEGGLGLPALGGLVGGLVGKVLGSAVQQIASELAKSAQDRDKVFEDAVHRIRASQRLRAKMGPVSVGPSLSQSVSSSSINGVTSKRIVLLAPVYGEDGRGSGSAQISYAEGPGHQGDTTILVQLPTGETVTIEGSGGGSQGPAGRTIDVDFTEVR